jgi:hypothetical protein
MMTYITGIDSPNVATTAYINGKHSASHASRKAIEMMMNRASADETASAFA